jgi:NlpC/P60 family putative phage cell wall peptidase
MTEDDIVAEARRWIGTPYRHQASLIGVGCDCLGLLRGVWRALVGDEPEATPPYAPGWAEDAGRTPVAEPLVAAARRHLVAAPEGAVRAGEVLLFRFRAHLPARHCAIATGGNAMVHAHAGAAVAEVAIHPWWARHRSHRFRFPGLPGA